jgi:hypothetical protein
VRRRDLRQLRRGGAAVPPPVRRPRGPHRDRRARGRARVLRARRPGRCPGRARPPRRPPGAAVRRPDPAAEGTPTWRCAPWPSWPTGTATTTPCCWWSAARAAPTATPRASGRTSSSTSSACTTGSGSCRRSRTTSCRRTTGRPTSCSCRAAARASGSSRSRPRRAACRSWRARSAGLLSLVDDGVTGILVREREPGHFAAAVARVLDDPALAASMARAGRARRFLHVGLRRGAAAPPVPRPGRRAPGGVHVSEYHDAAGSPCWPARSTSGWRTSPRATRRSRRSTAARATTRRAAIRAGTCGCSATRRTSPRCGSPSASARCATRRT